MLNEIFGGKCPSCGGFCRIDAPLCQKCLAKIVEFEIYCKKCGFPLAKAGQNCIKCSKEVCPHIRKIYGRYKYSGTLRDMVLDIKFRYNIRSALTFDKMIILPEFSGKYEAIFCVPSHFFRKFVRFFHPADIVAKYVAANLNMAVGKGLVRKKHTGFQHKLSAQERKGNVENVFEYVGFNKYKNVLLIDDILTTGSTLDACAVALKAGGVKNVDAFVFAVSGS